jgi:hypothetical protein
MNALIEYLQYQNPFNDASVALSGPKTKRIPAPTGTHFIPYLEGLYSDDGFAPDV